MHACAGCLECIAYWMFALTCTSSYTMLCCLTLNKVKGGVIVKRVHAAAHLL